MNKVSPDPNCLSTWFPQLERTGVPVPKTIIVRAPGDYKWLWPLLDDEIPKGFWPFIEELEQAGDALGWPAFLRTGHTSGKHYWSGTCFVRDASSLPDHVTKLVEFSLMADIRGLPTEVWAMREMLPVPDTFTAFNGLPINRERRYMIRDGQVVRHFPYWPANALRNASVSDWRERLAELNQETPEEIDHLIVLATKVAQAFPGHWSVDFLYTAKGWCCIDMAEGDKSWTPEDGDGE